MNVTWPCVIIMINGHVTVYHYNDTRSTVTRWLFDNGQRHVTAFRPISEAAHGWSYDNTLCQRQWRIEYAMVICCSRGRQVVTVVADQQHNILHRYIRIYLIHPCTSAWILMLLFRQSLLLIPVHAAMRDIPRKFCSRTPRLVVVELFTAEFWCI